MTCGAASKTAKEEEARGGEQENKGQAPVSSAVDGVSLLSLLRGKGVNFTGSGVFRCRSELAERGGWERQGKRSWLIPDSDLSHDNSVAYTSLILRTNGEEKECT